MDNAPSRPIVLLRKVETETVKSYRCVMLWSRFVSWSNISL